MEQICDAIVEHGALAVYRAACDHMAGIRPGLDRVGLSAANMGDVWTVQTAAYKALTDAERAIDYAQAQAELTTKFGG